MPRLHGPRRSSAGGPALVPVMTPEDRGPRFVIEFAAGSPSVEPAASDQRRGSRGDGGGRKLVRATSGWTRLGVPGRCRCRGGADRREPADRVADAGRSRRRHPSGIRSPLPLPRRLHRVARSFAGPCGSARSATARVLGRPASELSQAGAAPPTVLLQRCYAG